MERKEVQLPYRCEWSDVIRLVEHVRARPDADRSHLEARIGKGESFTETLNAAVQFSLIEEKPSGTYNLTAERGRGLAYAASDDERQQILLQIITTYEPYSVPLERALRDDQDQLESPTVIRIWQVDMSLGQRDTRVKEGVTFFFKLCQEANLGQYVRGYGKRPGRVELSASGQGMFRQALELETPQEVVTEPSAEPTEGLAPPGEPKEEVTTPPRMGASIQVNVDMTEWDLDKIRSFFRIIRGEETSA